jgi:hypothetical protein
VSISTWVLPLQMGHSISFLLLSLVAFFLPQNCQKYTISIIEMQEKNEKNAYKTACYVFSVLLHIPIVCVPILE